MVFKENTFGEKAFLDCLKKFWIRKNSGSISSGDRIKAFYKLNKLAYMRLQDPVPAVYNIEISFVFRILQRKQKNLFCFFQILNGTGGKNGNSQPVDNGFFDTFQIVHPCDHIQI